MCGASHTRTVNCTLWQSCTARYKGFGWGIKTAVIQVSKYKLSVYVVKGNTVWKSVAHPQFKSTIWDVLKHHKWIPSKKQKSSLKTNSTSDILRGRWFRKTSLQKGNEMALLHVFEQKHNTTNQYSQGDQQQALSLGSWVMAEDKITSTSNCTACWNTDNWSLLRGYCQTCLRRTSDNGPY